MAKPKYIETPELMWEYFTLYRDNTKNRPIKKHDFVGKDATEVERKIERPLTLEGFENYVANLDIISNLSNYFANSDNKYAEYSSICSRIRREIKQDQIEGGMAGIYNPSITQRLNGLKEQTENENINKNFDVTLDLGQKKPNAD